MCAVPVYIDPVLLLCIDISRYVVSAVDHKAFLSRLVHLMRKYRSV